MRQSLFKILFAGSALIFLASCGKGPTVVVCVYSADDQKFGCVDKEGRPFELSVTDSKADKLVCLPRGDSEKLLQWCHRGAR